LLQKDLESSSGGSSYVDQSLYDTVYAVCMTGDIKRATQIKESFRMPEKRFCWIRIKSLAQARRWVELDGYSKERKPPLGMESFADVCIEQNMPAEAAKYISRIPAPPMRAEYFMRIQAWKEAADAARDARDPDLLSKIANKVLLRRMPSFAHQFARRATPARSTTMSSKS
jgi:hypothetical protein